MASRRDRSAAQMRDMFKTRSHSWAEVGLARQVSARAARRARRQAAVLLPALVGVLVVYSYRQELFADGRLVLLVIVRSVAVNANLSDELFDPEALRRGR